MKRVELKIYYHDGSEEKQRAVVNKWRFNDSMMGEQYITFTITSEKPISWAVGDYCVFRGETFTLNYLPSVTQKARIKERQDSFTYENVKLESRKEELTRCVMLDITPTTGDYVAALGTNYTGSSKFSLFCGETSANGRTLTAVCALAAKIQANLDRMFPQYGWRVLVDTFSTYSDGSGSSILVTHTDDKILYFDNTTVDKALEEVHNTFDLDYYVRGRNIYIGYSLKNITSDDERESFVFGYGKGYPSSDDMNKGLFQIRKISNSQQKIVTRLRALGSTKNMPYRYYNDKYGGDSNPDLSQTLFPTNLQLPDTFIPEGSKSDYAGTNSKWGHNKQRASYLRAVKGDTNDSYIDKNDDAENCVEGIREDSARWDGSNSNLQEIYPTIEGATYGELRSALVEDIEGKTGQSSFKNYNNNERIDSLLAVGYLSDGSLIDDANTGNGILPESGIFNNGITKASFIELTTLNFNARDHGDFTDHDDYYAGVERVLFEINDVNRGDYSMAPTIGAVIYGFSLSSYKDGISADVGFRITVKQKSKKTGAASDIATYISDFVHIDTNDGIKEVELPEIPDVKNGSGAKVSSVTVTELSDITVTFTPIMRNITVPSGFTENFGLVYQVDNSRLDNTVTYAPEYTWISSSDEGSVEESFHVFVKDMGFDITACLTDETPVVAMKSGRCVGREFEIGDNVQRVTYNGKQGYMLTLKRATDSNLNTYYPSATDPISAGDYFVLLNISMPDVYVKMAEVRLLKAATDYLADNCETQFTYQPYIDDIYLQRNYDNMVAAGTPEKSIFWRLYAGMKFTFRGIPTNEDDPLPIADITIAQVSIAMGEGLTPRVDITLNDDIQQSTIQKLTTSVDRIYNGSLFNSGAGSNTGANAAALLSLIQSEGGKRFLSKRSDDTAAGVITFLRGLVAKGIITAEEGVQFGERFVPGYVGGQGGYIDKLGNGELESLMIRTFLEVPELRFNRIDVYAGDEWQTNGGGIIERVEIDKDASGNELNTGTIWLKLEDGEAGTLVVNDKVKGIYHNLLGDNDTESTDDGRGNRTFKGFRTVYFVVTAVNSDDGKFNNRLSYELRPTTNGYWSLDEGGSSGVRGGFHPQQSMSIAQYSNAADKSRQNSVYRTTRYTRMLRNMVGWDEHVYNIGMQFGATELLAQAATHTEPAAYDGLRERMRQADRYFMWLDGDIMFSGTLNRVDSWGRDMPDYPDQGTHIAGKQYFYNDLVHKDGVVWRCVYAEKDSDGNYLPCTSTPSENGDWEKWIYTDSLKASGHWQPGTYPVNAVVMLGNTAYISNKITSEPPVGLLTDKNGVYLKDNEGYYFIVNEETTDDWNVLIDVGGVTRGDDGESSVYITLTNDSDVLVTDSDGNVPAGTAYPSTMAQFYIGLSRILTGVVWSIDHTEGCSATIDAGGNVTTSNMTADRARVFINARYNDRDYQKIFGFRKSYGLTKYWLELSNDTVHFDPNTQAMSPRRILVHAYALTNGVKAAVTQASGLGRIVYNNNVIYDGDTITISREMFSDNHLILTLYDQPTTGGNVADAEDITFLEGGLNGQGIEDVGHWQSGRAYTHNEIAQLGNKRYIYYGDGSTTEPPVGLLLDKNGDYLVSRDGYYFPVTDECNEGWREFSADGVSITIERTEISYCATDSSERPSSGWSTQEPTVAEGQWLHVREIVVYSDGTITEKYSVSRAGIDGRGIREANVFYAKSATELAMPEDDDKVTWYDLYSKMPSPVAGNWIWTKTVTTYSDGTKVTSYNCGRLGTDGNKYLSTEEFYALGVDNENAPAGWNHITEEGKYLPNDQWRTNRNFTEAEWKAKPYLWNIEISSYSDGTQSRTNPMCIGNFARGIDHFEELYAISASSIPGTGRQYPSDITKWDDEAQNAAPTDAKPYQWNKTVCYYNDSTTEEHYHVSAVKGTQGTAGQNAIRVDLDNENDTMLYSKGGQLLSGNVTSHAYLYDGATLVSSGVTFAIQSQTGCTASISGNTLTVSAMSANAATVVVRATYKSKTYTTTLTLKKLVGVDRYEIVMSTTAANYNPNTKTVYPSTVNVEVYKTDSQGTRAKLTTLPTGFTLYLSNTSGSDGSAITYASGKYSFSPVATNAEYIFTLKEGTVVHDRESMPVVMDGEDGKSITKKSEVKAYAVSSSATTTPTSWQTTKPTVAQNQYLWTRTTITWSDNSTTVLYQSERNPNDGADGMSVQIKSQAVTYCRRTAAQGPVSDPSTLTYGSYPSTLSKGDWLYSRTVVTYQTSGGASAGSTTSYSVSYIGTDGQNGQNGQNGQDGKDGKDGQDGTNGADGRGITAITEYYAASASKTSAPATSAFKTTIPTDWNASKPYLWNFEKTDYSKAPLSESSTPAVIATYTENGRGVDSIVNHYLATSAGSGVTKSTSGWTTTVQAITAAKKYLWNYETITWIEKDGTTTTTETDPHIVGVYGDKGDQGPQGPQGPAGDGIDFAGHWLNGRSYQKGDIATIGNNSYIANAPTTEPPVGLLTDMDGNYITSKDGGYFPVTDEVNSSWDLMLSGGQAVTIVTDITEYVIVSQGETPPSSGWSQYRPATEQGKYLWERHTITFSEGTVNVSYNISYTAIDGEDGQDGDSITITQMAISYAVSKDGTAIPEEGWSDQMPTTEEGDYLYTRTVVRYSDGNQTVTFTKGYIGVNGETYYITASAPAVHVNADGVPTPAADEQIQTVVKSTVTAWKHVAGKDDVQVPVVWEGVDQSPYGTSSQVFVQFATDQQRIVNAYEQVQQSGSATPQKGRLLAQFVITVTKDGTNGKAGQGIVTSFVFKRAATKPTLPAATAGSFSSPVPTGWSDGIPAGTTPIWSTSRIFTSDGKSPQQSAWSPVRLMADTESYDVEFAKATADGKQPPAPTSANSIKGDTSANKIWYDPTEIDETTIKSEDMVWMAQRSRYVNESGNPVWSSWIISRIKGEQGAPGNNGNDAIVYDIVTDLDSLEAYTSQLTVSIRKTVGGTSQTFYINPDTAYATDRLSLSFAGALASKAQLRMGSPSLVYLTNSPHANGSSLILRLSKGGVQVAEKEIRASYVTQYLMTVSPSQINVDAGGQFMSNTDKKIVVHVLKMLGNSDPVVVTQADGMEVYVNAKYNETQEYPDSTGKVELTLDLRDTAKGSDGSRQPVSVELLTAGGDVINQMSIPIVASGAQGLQGCSTRVSEFKPNTAYVNQDGINMSGGDLSVGYIDVVAVEMPKDDARYEASDGYFWYMCMVPSTADFGYLAPANGQDTYSGNTLVWKALSAIGPSFFSLLIAKNAWIKFGSGNQFVIQDSEGNIVAGLTGYIPDPDNEDSSVRIWAGGEDPALSPFRVLQSGDFYAEKAHIKGLVEVRDANEGLIVYDSEGNARVQVVANEVDEPVNETITPSYRLWARPGYQIAADESFNLTPTPLSSVPFQLKTGAMFTIQGLSLSVSTNNGATQMKLTKRNGIAEKLTVTLVLMDTNGNVASTLTSTYEATADTLIDDISFAFQGVLITETKNYILAFGARIENINTYNSDADTWGGLTTGTTVTTAPSVSAEHATPVGTRIGTNGIFANLGQDKSVFINENSTEIKYGNNRLRVSGNGVEIYDGLDYVPIRKRTRTITSNYVVEKADGVLVLNSSSRITLTLRSTSSPEFKVICQNCPGYNITGMPVYKFNNSAPTDPWSSDDKRPRMFVSDGASTWYEFYCGN